MLDPLETSLASRLRRSEPGSIAVSETMRELDRD
jgi:hypothetical protein